MDTGDVIKQLREAKGWTQEQLGEKVGVKKSAVAKWENGRVENLKRSMIETLSKIFDVAPAIIMGWDDFPTNRVTNVPLMMRSIPVYGRIPANISFENIQDCLDEIIVPDKLAKKKDLFGLKITEDGMNKVIPVKSIAVFQRCTELNKEDIGLVTINEEDAIVRYYYKLKDGCLLEPASYNDEHVALIISKEKMDNVKILGRFVWYCMDLNEKL